jgi:hypothetical protein
MNWQSATAWAFGVMALLTIAILIVISIYYWRIKKQCASSSSSDSSSSSVCCPTALTTGPTGCFLIDDKSGCDTFVLKMDENACSSSSSSSSSLNCPRGTLTVKKPLPLDELVLTASVPTGSFITDIYAQVVKACCDKAKSSDFPLQTGCSVDLTLGYTAWSFSCTGGANVQSVTLPLAAGAKGAFLSVVVNVADTCGSPLVVDQLTLDGFEVPHRRKCCPKIPKTLGCTQPIPKYRHIKIPKCCKTQH